MKESHHLQRRPPRHLTLLVSIGLIVGLLAVTGIIYTGSSGVTFGVLGTFILGGALLVAVLSMAVGIAVIVSRYS